MQIAEHETSLLHKRVLRLMGNRFEISVLTTDESRANICIDAAVAEIQRIEKLLTTFKDDSDTNHINAAAGINPVTVESEVIELIQRSLKISAITQGSFDITYGSVDKTLWNFDKDMKSLPDAATAKRSVRLINYRNVIVNEKESTVFLIEKGMRIGFGGIGKGYAAEKAKTILQHMGIVSGIVNAAGDLSAWGSQENGEPWTIGIADPDARHHPFSSLNITNMAIATSGNYEKYVMIDGKKYSHTIDPKTGLPVSGIKSVTIIAPNAELADALATPVMVMGTDAGLHLINQLPGISCIIIDDNNKLYTSSNINIS
ncbi:MAG: FAD:protein FMN transferase [Chitinophagaceae bacterium]|nr:FAD:protein FMN transferase [Chitinophagaceae bacterium]